MRITHHGFHRGKERCGLDAKAMERTAPKAWAEGLKPADLAGRVRRWLDGMGMEHKGVYRIYGHHVFCFTPDAVLVTVLTVPVAHRGAIAAAMRKRGPEILGFTIRSYRSAEMEVGDE